MAQLILIRHSQTKQQPEVSSHEWQLTDTGRERCQRLAEELCAYAIDRIFTSEEPKAQLTGALVADMLDIPCETAPNLQETKRDAVPYFASLADFQAAVRAAMEEPDKLLFGEETFADARTRFTRQVNTLLEAYPAETIAIVTHGTVMALYLAQFSTQDVQAIWQSLDMPAYAVVSLPQKTITKLVTSVVQGTHHDDNSESG